MNEVQLKVYVKEKHNLPEIVNLFLICANLKNLLNRLCPKPILVYSQLTFLMVLDPFLYKVLSWSFMGVIRSELYCLGIRIKKDIAFLQREQTICGLRT